jgi:hypothetical protein
MHRHTSSILAVVLALGGTFAFGLSNAEAAPPRRQSVSTQKTAGDGSPDSADAARALILKFASAAFLDHDQKKALTFIAPTAVRKTNGPSSLVPFFDDALRARELKAVQLRSITFFTDADVASLSKQYPDRLWERARTWPDVTVRALIVVRIADKTGRVRVTPGEVPMIILGAKSVNGSPKIVYWDDN